MRKIEIALGAATASLGLYIVLLATDVLPIAEEGFAAPRWVAVLAGVTFILGGGLVALARGNMRKNGRQAGGWAWIAGLRTTLTMLLLIVFAAIGNWVAFGSGERVIAVSHSLPFFEISARIGSAIGRLGFAVGALILDGILLLGIIDLVKRARRSRA